MISMWNRDDRIEVLAARGQVRVLDESLFVEHTDAYEIVRDVVLYKTPIRLTRRTINERAGDTLNTSPLERFCEWFLQRYPEEILVVRDGGTINEEASWLITFEVSSEVASVDMKLYWS